MPVTRRSKVNEAVRQAVLQRDKVCFISRILLTHVCHDQWGHMHPCDATDKLSLDHVHLDGGHMGQRAPSDEMHMVAMCYQANVHGCMPQLSWRDIRTEERAYLRGLYG